MFTNERDITHGADEGMSPQAGNRSRGPGRGFRRFPWPQSVAVLGVLCGILCQSATASPIQHVHEAQQGTWSWDVAVARQGALTIQGLGSWEHQLAIQLAGARFFWPLHIHGRLHAQLRAVDGLLPNTLLVAYLHWKRSLNPARFDWFHPQWAPLLTQDLLTRMALLNPPVLHSAQLVEPPPQTHGPILPPTPPSLNSPEPSTALIALVLAGATAAARRWGSAPKPG